MCVLVSRLRTSLSSSSFFKNSIFLWSMFHKKYPSKAFFSRLILVPVQINKRLVTMSIRKPSEERKSERLRSSCALRIDEGQSAAGSSDAGTSSERASAHNLTQEEMAIHRIHREACEVTCITHKSSDTIVSCQIATTSHDEFKTVQTSFCCF